MNRAIFMALVLLLGSISSAWAYRIMEQSENAYELVLGEVSLPRSVTGSVIFKACPECMTDSLRVTSATTYFVNGAPLELANFLKAAAAIRAMNGGNQNAAVYVFLDIESQQVNRLVLDHYNG